MAMAKAMLPRSLPPLWMIVLVSLVCLSLIGAYVYAPGRYTGCYMSTTDCNPFKDWLPPIPARVLNDEELASRAVIRDILLVPPLKSMNPKIAFMFLTPGSLPFEKLWEKFFAGQEGRFSIYVHASREKPVHVSRLFIGRDIHSEKVTCKKHGFQYMKIKLRSELG